jgi:hypothetical protein
MRNRLLDLSNYLMAESHCYDLEPREAIGLGE